MKISMLALLVAAAGAAGTQEEEVPMNRNLRRNYHKKKKKRVAKTVCETFSGASEQKYMNQPLMLKLFQEQRLDIGDTFLTLIDKKINDVIDFGINTCQIINLIPNYELSCHVTLRGPNGLITATGDGAPNLFEPNGGSQPVKYAITGGTDKFSGAFGQIDIILDTITPSNPEDLPNSKFTSQFTFDMELCYFV